MTRFGTTTTQDVSNRTRAYLASEFLKVMYMDEERSARSPKPTAEESALHEKQVAASQVWGDGMRAIFQHPELAGEVADALKTILDKVPAEGAGRGCPCVAPTSSLP